MFTEYEKGPLTPDQRMAVDSRLRALEFKIARSHVERFEADVPYEQRLTRGMPGSITEDDCPEDVDDALRKVPWQGRNTTRVENGRFRIAIDKMGGDKHYFDASRIEKTPGKLIIHLATFERTEIVRDEASIAAINASRSVKRKVVKQRPVKAKRVRTNRIEEIIAESVGEPVVESVVEPVAALVVERGPLDEGAK